jgi:hypothetical protein
MKRIVDALPRDRDPSVGQTVLQFAQRDISIGIHHFMQPILVPGQFPFLLTADLTRAVTARPAPLADKDDRTRKTNAEPARRRTSRTSTSNGFNNSLAKIK